MHYGEITADMNLLIFGPIPLLNHSAHPHAPLQVANLALKVFSNANRSGLAKSLNFRFVISHRPYDGLKLRAGIHTGEVIAGVQVTHKKS